MTALVSLSLLVVIVTFVKRHGDEASYLVDPTNVELVAQGKTLYHGHCASCHGSALEGEPDWRTRRADGKLPAPPHDETGHTWHHRDELLFRMTKEGTAAIVGDDYQSDMPGFAAVLSDEEIRAVLSFIKSTWPAEIQRRHDERNNQAKR